MCMNNLLTIKQAKKLAYQNKDKSYVYILTDKDGVPFYVGVGVRNRLAVHVSKHELQSGANLLKINTILKIGIDNIRVKLFCFAERSYCLDMEVKLIAHFGMKSKGGILTNLTEGGEGVSGRKISESEKRKRSESAKLKAETFAEIAKNQWAEMTDEEKSARLNNLTKSRENPDTLKKLSDASKDRWSDDNFKDKMRIIQKESQEKVKHIHSSNMKAKWADPEFRDRMIAARREARQRKEQSKMKD